MCQQASGPVVLAADRSSSSSEISPHALRSHGDLEMPSQAAVSHNPNHQDTRAARIPRPTLGRASRPAPRCVGAKGGPRRGAGTKRTEIPLHAFSCLDPRPLDTVNCCISSHSTPYPPRAFLVVSCVWHCASQYVRLRGIFPRRSERASAGREFRGIRKTCAWERWLNVNRVPASRVVRYDSIIPSHRGVFDNAIRILRTGGGAGCRRWGPTKRISLL